MRAEATFPVTLTGHDPAAPASLRDLSEIGLACTSRQPIAEMTMVGLDFALPGQTERHHVKGAVVRCEPLGRAAGARAAAAKEWDVAVYFTEVTPVTRAALRHYVARAKKV